MPKGLEESFDKIKAISAGEQDPDAESIERMSASKMRIFAGWEICLNSRKDCLQLLIAEE